MNKKLRLVSVAGARPNFMKIASIFEAAWRRSSELEHIIVHTGQHYDYQMSRIFFDELGIPRPDVDLEIGSGTHAEQTGRVMIAFEKKCLELRPDVVVVVGDVNSTLACAVTAKKLAISVAHVEAGLRSGDMSMPEEINRRCTDAVSDLLFTTDYIADENLLREGVEAMRIHRVGNTMVDTLIRHRDRAASLDILDRWGLAKGKFAVLTLHRPSNVDHSGTLGGILSAIKEIAASIPVVFPVHPRTARMIESYGLTGCLTNGPKAGGIRATEPLGYLEFMHLISTACMVFTDSGGIQEETTVLGTPCITLRSNTERPITCQKGTNMVVGTEPDDIRSAAQHILGGNAKSGQIPELWDGLAGNRIVEVLLREHRSGR